MDVVEKARTVVTYWREMNVRQDTRDLVAELVEEVERLRPLAHAHELAREAADREERRDVLGRI